MEQFAVINASVVTDGEVFPGKCVVVENGVIKSVGQGIPENIPTLDAAGNYLVPGYIDMHIHGTDGHLADSGTSALEALSLTLPHYGVTGFLACVTPKRDDTALLRELSQARGEGAHILGFMLEGHYLKLTGAIPHVLNDYSPKRVKELLSAASPYSIAFAISPEIQELEELMPLFTSGGFPAFITHTCASPEQTERFISLGALHATHFYDVFPYPVETEPGRRACGAVEAIMADRAVSVDFILDGEHVEPIAVKMAMACKGLDGVCLISDANITAGLPPGVYRGLSDVEVSVGYIGGPARMTDGGGLVGSGL
ncbi:MAG: hypothetical protein FWB75_09335, partial [Oscillospiraceae bacterium]|nr:hypothetical protein [Oscillospiraceae bacterium]